MTAVSEAVWLYKDDNDVIRGPWDLCKMSNWYRSGFFHDKVRIMKTSSKDIGWKFIGFWTEITGKQRIDNTDETPSFKNENHLDLIEDKEENFDKNTNQHEADKKFVESTGMGVWRTAPVREYEKCKSEVKKTKKNLLSEKKINANKSQKFNDYKKN